MIFKRSVRKNFSKKVSFVFLFLLLGGYIFSSSAMGNDNHSRFLIKTNAVLSRSLVNENVFKNSEKESQISWTGSRPGLNVEIGYLDQGFDFLFSVYSAIPVELGLVEDKDYFTTGSNLGKTALYSKHGLITDKDYSFNLEAWYSLPIRGVMCSIGLSGVYSNFKAETDDGYLQYPENSSDVWTGTEDKEDLNGTAITYEQQRLYAGVGFMISSNLRQNCRFNYFVKGFWYSFVKIDAIDNHFLRVSQFCDSMQDKPFGYSVSAGCSYEFSQNFGLNLSAPYKYLEVEGTTKTSPIGIITYNTSSADESVSVGTNLYEFQFNIGAVCRF